MRKQFRKPPPIAPTSATDQNIQTAGDLINILSMLQNSYRIPPKFVPTHHDFARQGLAAKQMLLALYLHGQVLLTHRTIRDTKEWEKFSVKYTETLRSLEIYFHLAPTANPFNLPMSVDALPMATTRP